MNKYINKTELIKNIEHKYSVGCGCDTIIMNCIYNMPEETNLKLVESSEWIWDENAIDWNIGAWICKKCGVINHNILHEKNTNPYFCSGSKFCPECGRSMVKK